MLDYSLNMSVQFLAAFNGMKRDQQGCWHVQEHECTDDAMHSPADTPMIDRWRECVKDGAMHIK